MERRGYWRDLRKQLAEQVGPEGLEPLMEAGEVVVGIKGVALVWEGRELSPEAYLAVPTFLRRGLRPESRLCFSGERC